MTQADAPPRLSAVAGPARGEDANVIALVTFVSLSLGRSSLVQGFHLLIPANPFSATCSGHRRFAFFPDTVRHLGGCDLFESYTRRLVVVTHHPGGGAA